MNILPSYKCNLSCPFCIIHSKDKGDLLDFDWLENTLKDIPSCQIDILGGEPSLLPDSYMQRLLQICKQHAGRFKVGMYTNLVKISPFVNDVDLTVSFDPGSRQLSNKVMSNMLLLNTSFEINMIVTKHVVNRGAKWLQSFARKIKNIKKITLSTLTSFPGCVDLRPNPAELADFCRDIILLNDRHIYFYPIATWESDFIKAADPVQVAEILPDHKFRVALRDFFGAKEFDTFKQAADYYSSNYASSEPYCVGCPYFRRCTHMYTDGNSCSADRMITETIISTLKEREGCRS